MPNVSISPHAIQLNYVGVKELHFDSSRLPSMIEESQVGTNEFATGRTDYDPEKRTIQVFVKFTSRGTEEVPYKLCVELVGDFRVDEEAFPPSKIHDWAERAAFYVLYPYLREHVFSLSMKSGLKAMTLPLLQIPTFKVTQPEPVAALA